MANDQPPDLKPPERYAAMRWHWLRDSSGTGYMPASWKANHWTINGGYYDVRDAWNNGFRYHGPCDPNALTLDLDADVTAEAVALTLGRYGVAISARETIARAVCAKLRELSR